MEKCLHLLKTDLAFATQKQHLCYSNDVEIFIAEQTSGFNFHLVQRKISVTWAKTIINVTRNNFIQGWHQDLPDGGGGLSSPTLLCQKFPDRHEIFPRRGATTPRREANTPQRGGYSLLSPLWRHP